MSNEYFLGIDISTTSSKALLIDKQGIAIGSASSPHTTHSTHPLWSEQDPLEWWDAVSESIQTVLKNSRVSGKEVISVGLTGQMHGLVLLDGESNILRPAILWNDQRTQTQCDEIHRTIGKEKFLQITGNIALPGFTAPKIIWVAQNEPEIYKKIQHILIPKDYIRFRLTGEFATDKADGSGTVLFDIHQRDWSLEILERLNIPREWLPKSFEGTEITGFITPLAASQTGLIAGTPVAGGGGDQASQAVGVGAVRPGILALTLGTSGVVFASSDKPAIEQEGKLHTFCHAVPNTWHMMGVMLSAAGSLKWYHDTFTPDLSYDDLVNSSKEIPAGSEGLLFLPYLTGERTPYPDPLARGAFIGLTGRQNQANLVRAVLEGVSFGLRDCFGLIKSSGLGSIGQVRASGGGIQSPVWRQILADILGVELVTVNTNEGAAFGAALLAGVGVGYWKNVYNACDETVRVVSKTEPNLNNIEKYNQVYQEYQLLYTRLKPTFEQEAKF